jgi:hypothetical protein
MILITSNNPMAKSGRQVALALLLTVLTVAGLAFLFMVNPSQTKFLPVCLFHELTHLHCPGCGMTRALHQLMHGQILQALRCNALFTLFVPVVAVILLWRGQAKKKNPSVSPLVWKPVWTMLLLGTVLVFGVVRNIPSKPFTWLAPQVTFTQE